MTDLSGDRLWESLQFHLGELNAPKAAQFEASLTGDELFLSFADAVILESTVRETLRGTVQENDHGTIPARHATSHLHQDMVHSYPSLQSSIASTAVDRRRAGQPMAVLATVVCIVVAIALPLFFNRSQPASEPIAATEEFPYELVWSNATIAANLDLSPESGIEQQRLDEIVELGRITDVPDVPSWMLAAVSTDDVGDAGDMPLQLENH